MDLSVLGLNVVVIGAIKQMATGLKHDRDSPMRATYYFEQLELRQACYSQIIKVESFHFLIDFVSPQYEFFLKFPGNVTFL
jgi:hypothetical protein